MQLIFKKADVHLYVLRWKASPKKWLSQNHTKQNLPITFPISTWESICIHTCILLYVRMYVYLSVWNRMIPAEVSSVVSPEEVVGEQAERRAEGNLFVSSAVLYTQR